MQVFIPSMQRADRQKTLNALLAAKVPVTLVVPKNELKAYVEATPDVGVTVLACPAKGIALTRQWIMENASEPRLVMFDDDLSFHTRRTDDPTKFTNSTPAEVKALIKELDNTLRVYAHASMAPRQGGNRITTEYLECSRPWRCFGFNVKMFNEAGAKFNKGMVQDDYDVTLQLLKAGFPNRILCKWVNDQGGHGVTPGGTSTYRTVEDHNASVLRLAKMHAPYVRVVEKHTKAEGGWGDRLETVISWKKALGHAR